MFPAALAFTALIAAIVFYALGNDVAGTAFLAGDVLGAAIAFIPKAVRGSGE